MPTMGVSGVNASLEYCATAGGTYVVLASVKDFKPSGFEKKHIEVKALRIPSAWVQSLAGFKDGGTVDFNLEHLGSEAAILFGTIFSSNANYFYKFLLDDIGAGSTPTTIAFEATMTKCQLLSVDEEGKVGNSVSLKISGIPTFAVNA